MGKKKINKTSRKEFIKSVARDVIKGLSEKDIEYIKANPDPLQYHFSLGMYIRNKYIYGKELMFFIGHPDDLSGEIVEEIIKRLTTIETEEAEKETKNGAI